MKGVVDLVRTLGPARLAAMGAVGAGLLGFFIFLALKLSQPGLGVLFTDLDLQDSMAVVKKLDGIGVPYEVKQEGAIILAPKDRVLRLRMEMAQGGLPAGGGVGYEIFDKGDTLGSTSFVQNINRLRATEGELARTIRSLDRVEAARVHLVLPQRQLFAREAPEPSAAIVIKARGRLEGGQIKAIQHLVASSVEGLDPARVSIVDEAGKLLASGRGAEGGGGSGDVEERNLGYERRLQQDIEEIVGSVVGAGRTRVNVSAEMDYNKITQTSDTFDPDSRVARSTQSREESSSVSTPGADGSVSVGNELPSASAEQGSARNQDKNTKAEETVNYEISRTTKTEVIEAGRVKRISVAVLVDGIYAKSPDGKVAYAPRPQTQMEEIAALVRSAIGFDQARGDQVHVANLPFAVNETMALEAAAGGWLDLDKGDYFNIAELVVLGLISLCVLAFVVRPLVRRILASDVPRALQIASGGLQLALPSPSGSSAAAIGMQGSRGAAAVAAGGAGGAVELPAPSRAAELIKLAKVSGEVRAASVREVGEMVQSNPDDAVNIVRSWLEQGA